MARNTTRQGANFELDVMHHLDHYGYTSLRSSGSRGAVDVLSLGRIDARREILAIQCKISNPVIPPAERLALMGFALRAGAVPIVAFKAKEGRLRPIRFRELTGPGPKEWREWAPIDLNESGESNE